jgi:guanylate kinase
MFETGLTYINDSLEKIFRRLINASFEILLETKFKMYSNNDQFISQLKCLVNESFSNLLDAIRNDCLTSIHKET